MIASSDSGGWARGVHVGNAPCSWGIMGGFTPDPMPTYRDVLDGIAASGFDGTELGDWGFMPPRPAELAAELAKRGLQMIGAFTPVRLSDPDAHAASEAIALRTAHLLSALQRGIAPGDGPYVILAEAPTPTRIAVAGRVAGEHGMSDAQWKALASGAERIATSVREQAGLPVVFHHHSGTHVETEEETARFLEATDPDLIGLCFDTGHFAYAGVDPLRALKRFGKRIRHVHFKDMRNDIATQARDEGWDYQQSVSRGLFCELGGGDIGFDAILEYLRAFGYDGWIVVEDEMPPGACDPLENARHDRAYLRALGV